MVKEWQDITGSNCLKGLSGKLIVDEKGIKDPYKEYMGKRCLLLQKIHIGFTLLVLAHPGNTRLNPESRKMVVCVCVCVCVCVRGRLWSSCVRSDMLRESETWSVRKQNQVTLQRAEMRMVWWVCDIKVKDRVPDKKSWERERLGLDDIILVLPQNKFQWHEYLLRKKDSWVKKCTEYEVDSWPSGRLKRTWRDVQNDY